MPPFEMLFSVTMSIYRVEIILISYNTLLRGAVTEDRKHGLKA